MSGVGWRLTSAGEGQDLLIMFAASGARHLVQGPERDLAADHASGA